MSDFIYVCSLIYCVYSTRKDFREVHDSTGYLTAIDIFALVLCLIISFMPTLNIGLACVFAFHEYIAPALGKFLDKPLFRK